VQLAALAALVLLVGRPIGVAAFGRRGTGIVRSAIAACVGIRGGVVRTLALGTRGLFTIIGGGTTKRWRSCLMYNRCNPASL
jgi:hypothetical protein